MFEDLYKNTEADKPDKIQAELSDEWNTELVDKKDDTSRRQEEA